jgi:DNA-binding NarL/FixJ family response regulator
MTDKLQRTTGVLIVDDDLLARRAIAEYLSLVSDFTVQGAAATAEEALALVQDSPPDMVLLDVRMPGMDGIEACARIRQLAPDAIIIMMTSFDDEDLLRRAVAAGASGYLLKNVRAAQLIVALRAARQGLPAMSPELLSILRARSEPAGPTSDFPALTTREVEVLDQLYLGRSNAQIAAQLSLSVSAVKMYVHALMAKFEAQSRLETIARARAAGFQPSEGH